MLILCAKTFDYSGHLTPKRRQSAQNSLSVRLNPTYDDSAFSDWSTAPPVVPPSTTMAPSSMHLSQRVDQIQHNDPEDEINRILQTINSQGPTLDRDRFPQAAAQVDQFNQDLSPLQNHPNLELATRPRQPNEPWAGASLDNTLLPPSISRHISEPSYSNSMAFSLPANTNTQSYRFNPTVNIFKAHTEYNFNAFDSAYGSGPSPCTRSTMSAADPTTQSIFSGDFTTQGHESSTITNDLHGLDLQSHSEEISHFDPFADDNTTAVDPSFLNSPAQAAMAAEIVSEGPPWRCAYCNIDLKNRSEQKYALATLTSPAINMLTLACSRRRKHTLRHVRPFKCSVQGCSSSIKGFPTRNDLDRHQKSVHKIAPASGTDRTFKCQAPNCRHARKIWPRADNFRQHCSRLHSDMNTDELVNASLVSSVDHGYVPQQDLGNMVG